MNNPSGSRVLLDHIYKSSFNTNERNLLFWEEYLETLKNLDFTVYSDKLKVPILVPIGARILFKGEVKHTNEVTVALGADYFVKCSVKQAELIRQRRIKDAERKLNQYKQEREYLACGLEVRFQNLFPESGEDIMEPYNEEEDKIWRTKHRQNIRKYKQKQEKNNTEDESKLTDEELWQRLEELELKEELEKELEIMEVNEKIIEQKVNQYQYADTYNEIIGNKLIPDNTLDIEKPDEIINRVHFDDSTVAGSSEDILQKVLDKQSELEQKLADLKNRERVASKTEDQLMSRLDELEQLDQLEDDIDRLDDILYNNKEEQPRLKRKNSVTFSEENDEETIDITFNHSEVNPDFTPYDSKRGICKPTDVYEAFPQLFEESIKSILKKTSYNPSVNIRNLSTVCEDLNTESDVIRDVLPIEIKDVQENIDVSENVSEIARPPSLFKLRRQQQKKSNNCSE